MLKGAGIVLFLTHTLIPLLFFYFFCYYRQSGCDNNSERRPRLVQIPVGRLALYILALESTCHDTTDFYGNDLVEILERNMKHFPRNDFNNYFQYSMGVLALCQSGTQAVKLKHIRQLLEGQEDDGCYMFDGQG